MTRMAKQEIRQTPGSAKEPPCDPRPRHLACQSEMASDSAVGLDRQVMATAELTQLTTESSFLLTVLLIILTCVHHALSEIMLHTALSCLAIGRALIFELSGHVPIDSAIVPVLFNRHLSLAEQFHWHCFDLHS